MINKEFEIELRSLINKHSIDTYVNTADYIIAVYLINRISNLKDRLVNIDLQRDVHAKYPVTPAELNTITKTKE